MRIFIDADGNPVRKSVENIAKINNLKVVMVSNHCVEINSDYAEIVKVDKSNDSADYYITNNINKGDIVVTGDYGLCAMVISRGGLCINNTGTWITDRNLMDKLNNRYIQKQEKRKHGVFVKHHQCKRKEKDNLRFENGLNDLISLKLQK